MLIIKTSSHIRNALHIKGYHSCRHVTGFMIPKLDLARISLEKAKLGLREGRRLWLAGQWHRCFSRAP
jgi:hypothetical protein